MGRCGFESRRGNKIFYMTEDQLEKGTAFLSKARIARRNCDLVTAAFRGQAIKISLHIDSSYVCELYPSELADVVKRLDSIASILEAEFGKI